MSCGWIPMISSINMKKVCSNFLTFDVEEWYMANYEGLDTSAFENQKSDIEQEIDSIIKICERRKIRVTCFVVGQLAERKPHIVRALADAGHEIASHGYAHKLVYPMTPKEFSEDLKRSCDILNSITGKRVAGFRAPSWSVRRQTLEWYYDVLEEHGLSYSSSVFPARTYLYGIENFPEHIHYPVVAGRVVKVCEIPQRLTRIMGKRMGFSGGFYMRLFPKSYIVRQVLRHNAAGHPVFLYLHPRELNPNAPRLPLSMKDSLVHYWGVRGCRGKLEAVLDLIKTPFITLQDCVQDCKF